MIGGSMQLVCRSAKCIKLSSSPSDSNTPRGRSCSWSQWAISSVGFLRIVRMCISRNARTPFQPQFRFCEPQIHLGLGILRCCFFYNRPSGGAELEYFVSLLGRWDKLLIHSVRTRIHTGTYAHTWTHMHVSSLIRRNKRRVEGVLRGGVADKWCPLVWADTNTCCTSLVTFDLLIWVGTASGVNVCPTVLCRGRGLVLMQLFSTDDRIGPVYKLILTSFIISGPCM